MKATDASQVAPTPRDRLAGIALVGLLAIGAGQTAMAQGIEAQIEASHSALGAGDFNRALTLADSAIRTNPERWDGYALAGQALLDLQQYEPAADALSKAIERAPESEQAMLRELRRQCLVAESMTISSPPTHTDSTPSSRVSSLPAVAVSQARAAAIPPASSSNLQSSADSSLWLDPSTGLSWARPWYYPTDGAAASWNFPQAQSFCAKLDFGGYSNWRLPSMEELQHVFLASSKSWHWSNPTFAAGFGIDDALAHKQWRPADFVLDGDHFEGNRLLLWTSTSSGKEGAHVGLYFGKPYIVKDNQQTGMSFEGSIIRTPYHGYALCVHSAQ